jgi:hypothetical protein
MYPIAHTIALHDGQMILPSQHADLRISLAGTVSQIGLYARQNGWISLGSRALSAVEQNDSQQ